MISQNCFADEKKDFKIFVFRGRSAAIPVRIFYRPKSNLGKHEKNQFPELHHFAFSPFRSLDIADILLEKRYPTI
jgi:hypothetical protein